MPSPIMQARRYFISRVPDASGEIDPTGPLEFFPPKDSDELYEALKEAFPRFKTHKERVREAVIDFHLQEREDERAMNSSISTLGMTSFTMPDSSVTPAWVTATPMIAQHSQSSFETTPEYLPSPESLLNNTFPSTPATEAPSEHVSAVPSSAAASLREMTSVWCVSSSAQPKIRTRRAMTEAEKKEYRKKRVAGACTECKRRRRKCDHGSSDAESSKHCIKKPRKSSRPKATAPPPTTSAFLEQSSATTSPSQGSLESPQAAVAGAPDLPSSVPWSASMELFDMFADFDASAPLDFVDEASMHDPVFDFIDFGHDSNQLHQTNLPEFTWNTQPQHTRATSSQHSESRRSETRLNVEETGALHSVSLGSQVLPSSRSTEINPRLEALARVSRSESVPGTPRPTDLLRTDETLHLSTSTARGNVLPLNSETSETSLRREVIATMPRQEPHTYAARRTDTAGVLPHDPRPFTDGHEGMPGLPEQEALPAGNGRTAVPGQLAQQRLLANNGRNAAPGQLAPERLPANNGRTSTSGLPAQVILPANNGMKPAPHVSAHGTDVVPRGQGNTQRLPSKEDVGIVPGHDAAYGLSTPGSYATETGHTSAVPGILPALTVLGALAIIANLLPSLATAATASKLAMVWLSLVQIHGDNCTPKGANAWVKRSGFGQHQSLLTLLA